MMNYSYWIAWIAAFTTVSGFANAQNQAQLLVQQAHDAALAGRFAESLAQGLKALDADNTLVAAHYYVSHAYFRLGQFDEAKRYCDSAQRLPGMEFRDALIKLADAITKQPQFDQLVAQAESAEKEGLFAKAATHYAKAWQLIPQRGEIGVKAVGLLLDYGDIDMCLLIARTVPQFDKDPTTLSDLATLADRLRPRLESRFQQLMSAGQTLAQKGDHEEAYRTFERAATIMDDQIEPQLWMAAATIASAKMKEPQPADDAGARALGHLLKAIKIGRLSTESLLASDALKLVNPKSMEWFLASESVGGKITDALGPEKLALLRRHYADTASALAAEEIARRDAMEGIQALQADATRIGESDWMQERLKFTKEQFDKGNFVSAKRSLLLLAGSFRYKIEERENAIRSDMKRAMTYFDGAKKRLDAERRKKKPNGADIDNYVEDMERYGKQIDACEKKLEPVQSLRYQYGTPQPWESQ